MTALVQGQYQTARIAGGSQLTTERRQLARDPVEFRFEAHAAGLLVPAAIIAAARRVLRLKRSYRHGLDEARAPHANRSRRRRVADLVDCPLPRTRPQPGIARRQPLDIAEQELGRERARRGARGLVVAVEHPADARGSPAAQLLETGSIKGDEHAAIEHLRQACHDVVQHDGLAEPPQARALDLDERGDTGPACERRRKLLQRAGSDLRMGDPESPGLAHRQARDLGPREVEHRVRTTAHAPEVRVVKKKGNAVRAQLHVELDVPHAQVHGGLQRLEGVLRELGRVAAVRDDRRQRNIHAADLT